MRAPQATAQARTGELGVLRRPELPFLFCPHAAARLAVLTWRGPSNLLVGRLALSRVGRPTRLKTSRTNSPAARCTSRPRNPTSCGAWSGRVSESSALSTNRQSTSDNNTQSCPKSSPRLARGSCGDTRKRCPVDPRPSHPHPRRCWGRRRIAVAGGSALVLRDGARSRRVHMCASLPAPGRPRVTCCVASCSPHGSQRVPA